jgi:hypothetical protein
MAKKKRENTAIEVNTSVMENNVTTGLQGSEAEGVTATEETAAAVETETGDRVENDTLVDESKKAEDMNMDTANEAENTEAGKAETTEKNTNESTAGENPADTKEKAARRESGSGSVWKQANGKFGWCVQLTRDKTLKGLYGNKLRLLGSKPTYEEASLAAQAAIANKDELLKAKLIKLGHVFEVEGTGDGENNTTEEA